MHVVEESRNVGCALPEHQRKREESHKPGGIIDYEQQRQAAFEPNDVSKRWVPFPSVPKISLEIRKVTRIRVIRVYVYTTRTEPLQPDVVGW
jgi:hypothetical protein